MTTGISTTDVLKNIQEVENRLVEFSKTSGTLRIIDLPAQSTVNDIHVNLKELAVKGEPAPDVIIVDYLDLLTPSTVKVSVSDQFVKDKYVSEELRNLAREYNVPLITASQLNRGAVDAQNLDHSHIAGGISKINTADNVVGIFTSPKQKENGEFELQFLKTRNSNGVGSKVILNFDVGTLRLTNGTSFMPGGQQKAGIILGNKHLQDKVKVTSHQGAQQGKNSEVGADGLTNKERIQAMLSTGKFGGLVKK